MISVNNLTVAYGSVLALKDVSFSLRPGTITGLVGMNGSGKSTLFKSLAGHLVPQSGDIKIDGKVAYMPQSEEVDWNFPFSVHDVVLTAFRRPNHEDKKKAEAALKRVNLWELRKRQIGELSGGQKKRVFVARALAQEANALFLDEPFAGVDMATEKLITEVLQERARDGALVLVATHDLKSLPDLADECLVIRQRVIAHGTPEEALTPEILAKACGLS